MLTTTAEVGAVQENDSQSGRESRRFRSTRGDIRRRRELAERRRKWGSGGVAMGKWLIIVGSMALTVYMYQYVFPEEPVSLGSGPLEVELVTAQIEIDGAVGSVERFSSPAEERLVVNLAEDVSAVGLAFSDSSSWSNVPEIYDEFGCWQFSNSRPLIRDAMTHDYGLVARKPAPTCSETDSFIVHWTPSRGWTGPIAWTYYPDLAVVIRYDSISEMPDPEAFMKSTYFYSPANLTADGWPVTPNGDHNQRYLIRNIDLPCNLEDSGIQEEQRLKSMCSNNADAISDPYRRSIPVTPSATEGMTATNFLSVTSPDATVAWQATDYESRRELYLVVIGVTLGLVAAGVYAELDQAGRWFRRRRE